MCIEDVRLGRKTKSIYQQISVPTVGWVEIAKANPKRTVLVFGVSSTNQCSVYPADLGNAIAVGFGVGSTTGGDGTLSFNIKEHGDLVCRAWWGHSNGAGATIISIIEAELQEE